MAFPLPGSATNYYLSNAGSDSNNGTSSATPWQTLAQLNLAVLLPGDSVLFEAGSVFRGELMINSSGTETAKIYFGSYGTGALPVISGAEPVTGWSYYGGNTYKAGFSQTPAHLFADDQQMTIARYPNSGYLIHQDGISNTGFVDTLLTQPNGYWNGATVRMRTNDRLWESQTVTTFSGDSILFQTSTLNSIPSDFGFYFDHLLSLLDSTNEWFGDTANATLYFIAPGNVDPSSMNVEASVYDYGIWITNGSGNITIENLQLEKQRLTGVFVETTSSNIIINTSTFLAQGESGVRSANSSNNFTITENTFNDINGFGLSLSFAHNALIAKNVFKRIGLVAGYGLYPTNNMTAIECFDCDSIFISQNDIDSAGCLGIFAAATHSVISKNHLNYCLLNINSLGSIYVYGEYNDSTLFENNIILNSVGNIITEPHVALNAVGIYVDESATENILEGNTIAYATTGILVARNSSNNVIHQNLVYGSDESQLKFAEGALQGSTIGNVVTGNTFYSLNESADVVKMTSSYNSFNPAQFDSNYYFNPYAYHVVKTELAPGGNEFPRYYTLDQWQNKSGMDEHSHATFFNRNRFSVSDTIGSNLISNSFFTNNFDGWLNFHPDTLAMLLDNSTPLDNGCLKINFLLSLPDIVYGSSYASFQLDSGAFYQLHLSNYSIKYGNVIVKCKEFANFGGENVAVPRALPFDESRNDYNSVIQTFNNCEDCYLTLDLRGVDSIVWVDNITLYPVIGLYEEPEKKSRLFLNQTDSSVTFDLGDSMFFSLDQLPITGSLVLAPYSSAVLIFDSSMISSVREHIIPQLLRIFPNPVIEGGTITLLLSQASNDCEISICNLQGKRIFDEIVSSPHRDFQLKIPSFISPGTYFISYRNKYGVWSGKIVVI